MPQATLGTWPLPQTYHNGSSLKETATGIKKIIKPLFLITSKRVIGIFKNEPEGR